MFTSHMDNSSLFTWLDILRLSSFIMYIGFLVIVNIIIIYLLIWVPQIKSESAKISSFDKSFAKFHKISTFGADILQNFDLRLRFLLSENILCFLIITEALCARYRTISRAISQLNNPFFYPSFILLKTSDIIMI